MIFKARFIPVCVFFACLQVHFQAFVFLFLGRGDCKYKTLPKTHTCIFHALSLTSMEPKTHRLRISKKCTAGKCIDVNGARRNNAKWIVG